MDPEGVRDALRGRRCPGPGVPLGGPFGVVGADHGTRVWVLDGPGELARAVGDALAVLVRDVCHARRWCHLALTGGRFARPVFDEFALRQVPWGDVEFYFTDEVGEPVYHPASSYGVAHDRLFIDPRIGGHQIHRIQAEHRDLSAVAEHYADTLPEAFDVVLAMVGDRGELAALEPGSPAVDERAMRYREVRVSRRPVRRVSCTGGEFESCESLVVVAEGAARAEVVARALLEAPPPRELPAVLGLGVEWYLDRDAARGLDGRLEPWVWDGR